MADLSAAGCGAAADHPGGELAVVSVTPASDAGDVPLDAVISVELDDSPAPDFDVDVRTAQGDAIPHAIQIDGTTVRITPNEPLSLATDYQIEIAAGARSATGDTLGDAFTSKFATRDGLWSTSRISSTTTSGLAATPLGLGSAPALAVAADGTVLASWDSGSNVFDQRYLPGTGWAAGNGSVAVHDPDDVQIALARSNRAFAAFEDFVDGTHPRIVTRTFDGTGWSAPVTAAEYVVGGYTYDQYEGGIATDDSSRALTFLRGSWDLQSFKLYALLDTGSGWSLPIAVGAGLPGSAIESKIARDNHGGYIIVWVQRTDSKERTSVWMAPLAANGTLGAPVQLDDGPDSTYGLSIASAGDRVQIAWAHADGNIGLRIVTRGVVAGTLEPAHQIAVDSYSFGGESVGIACSSRQAVLVWTQLGGVYAQTGSGATWSATATIDPMPTVIDYSAQLQTPALDEHGNAAVAWTRRPAHDTNTAWVSRLRGGQWSAPAELGDATVDTFARAAGVDAAGRITVMFDRLDLSVWAARLE
jgi:hypothetical protein